MYNFAKLLKKILRNNLFMLREILYRLPSPLFYTKSFKPQNLERAKLLENSGIIVLPNYLSEDRLKKMQAGFAQMIEHTRAHANSSPTFLTPKGHLPQVMTPLFGYSDELKMAYHNDAMEWADEFSEFVFDEDISEILEIYYKNQPTLSRFDGSRNYPGEHKSEASWNWHTDAWGKYLKVFVLLTDVPENGHCTYYAEGTHKTIYNYDRTVIDSRFSDAEVAARGANIAKVIAPAGSVAIFDTNGLHRGNRSLVNHRDSVVYSYTMGRYLWKITWPEKFKSRVQSYRTTAHSNSVFKG